jgi:hypothetical protein
MSAQMVTIMIGANDFCSHTCYLKNFSIMPQLHKESLIKALNYLKDNMPRTIVNLVPPPREYVRKHTHGLQRYYISQLCACGLATTRNKPVVMKKTNIDQFPLPHHYHSAITMVTTQSTPTDCLPLSLTIRHTFCEELTPAVI